MTQSLEHTSSFGYKDLPVDEKVEAVRKVFSNVAPSYDLMNDVMSGGVHHVWKDMACDRLNPQPGEFIVDVAGGTGDIARRLSKRARAAKQRRAIRGQEVKDAQILIIDYNEAMIEAGRAKSAKLKAHEPEISWMVGDAQALALPDHCLDAYIISFGIRNVADVNQALKEAKRVLKPGGRFFCLEFSKPRSGVIQSLYDRFSFNFIPFMGEWIAKDKASYQYLVESIRRFPDQETFLEMIKAAGFLATGYENYANGIAALHFGRA